MIRAARPGARATAWSVLLIVATLLAGCVQRHDPAVRMRNPWSVNLRVAVAPALNFTGSRDIDPDAVADLMASELSYVEGFEVIPVSRVLAVLTRQGLQGIESPAHARAVCEVLGADAILVFAVTEYDPYEPPVVGIAAQLYGSDPGDRLARVDPVLVSRSAAPLSQRLVAPADQPMAQVSRVYNAASESTVRGVKQFAGMRSADDSAFGWRKYTASQQHYLRFCCHATIKELVQSGVNRQATTNSS